VDVGEKINDCRQLLVHSRFKPGGDHLRPGAKREGDQNKKKIEEKRGEAGSPAKGIDAGKYGGIFHLVVGRSQERESPSAKHGNQSPVVRK